MKYYGEYLIGTQSSWQLFATEFGIDVQGELLPKARRSTQQTTQGEWFYLIELWNTDFHMVLRAWKLGLLPFKQWQAQQLGAPIANIKGKDGLPLIENGNIISGRESAILPWVYALEPTMPDDLTPAEILSFIQANNTKNKLIALFNAFEIEEII